MEFVEKIDQSDEMFVFDDVKIFIDKKASLFLIGTKMDYVKGELESNLKALDLKGTLIFQPSLLLGDRNEFRFGEIVFSAFAKIFSWITPSSFRAIHCQKVAQSMLEKTISSKDGFNIISNKEMHKIA